MRIAWHPMSPSVRQSGVRFIKRSGAPETNCVYNLEAAASPSASSQTPFENGPRISCAKRCRLSNRWTVVPLVLRTCAAMLQIGIDHGHTLS